MNKFRKNFGFGRQEFRRKVRDKWAPYIVFMLVVFFLLCILSNRSTVEAKERVDVSYPVEIQSLSFPDEVRENGPDAYLSGVFTPEVLYWSDHIVKWSEEFDLDPNLIATVMQIESCGHPSVVSRSGAIGLFQVMPYHFTSQDDPYDPSDNAKRGLAYLVRSFELAEGHWGKVFVGYNGGHSIINQPRSAWSEETRRYAKWGSGILKDIQNGKSSSPTLQRWLDSNGAYLCTKASIFLGLE